ncbi:MAG: hypothetical protein ABR514_09640 [Chthoniobacterales bacterium]
MAIGLSIVELLILSSLIVATRCANYRDVFVAGNVYFTDSDCYARMTRARMCAEHPGLIVRHHDFEDFPTGTMPHTTAPLDYLIVALSILLAPFTAHALDLAGAFVSPLLALCGGWFLWWWSRRMRFRYRWGLLILYVVSPILVHGGELGRPDHQSLLILLVTIAICAEWTLRIEPSRNWSLASGIAWGLAIWVSAYEPFVLLLLILLLMLFRTQDRQLTFGRHRRIGWIVFAAVIGVALLIERRIPSLSIFYARDPIFQNWARAIGELARVPPLDPIWFRWVGYMIVIAPILIWTRWSKSMNGADQHKPIFVIGLLIATYLLTICQARWAYFFAVIFALALPVLLEPIQSRAAVWVAFILSMFPVAHAWDERLWPDELAYARRVQQRNDSVQLRDLALVLRSPEKRAFLAPWWISPPIAYWSGQPGVAGSSHESIEGIADTARFFLAHDWQIAREILLKHEVAWVVAYDAERVAQNSEKILGVSVPQGPAVCFALDRTPARAPLFLSFSGQNGAGKLYRVVVSNR